MENKFNKLYEYEKESQRLQQEILKELINKATNKDIRNFLIELLENQYDVARFNELLTKINELKLHTLDIGSKISKNIGSKAPNELKQYFAYNYYIDNDDEYSGLAFTINDQNIIEDIEYYRR